MKFLLNFILFLVIFYYADADPGIINCTIPGFQSWVTIDNSNHCYYFSNRTERYSWHDAEEYCRSLGTHLISIHDPNTNQLIVNYTRNHTITASYYWVGLNSLRSFTLDYKWSDGTLRDFGNFTLVTKPKNPMDAYSQGKCVTVNKLTGAWEYTDCNDDYQNFICQKNKVDSNPVQTTTSAPPGNCPSDWIKISDQKCIKYIDGNFTQQDAIDKCKSIQADILSIHSRQDQSFITAFLLNKRPAWIGLMRILTNSYYKWSWIDQSRIDFLNWATTKPSSVTYDKCVELLVSGFQAGTWNNTNCNFTKSVICERSSDSSLPSQPSSYFQSCNISGFENLDMVQYRNSCYKIMEKERLSWDDARAECNQLNPKNPPELLSIHDFYEHSFISFYSKLNSNSDQFWIGFYANETKGKNKSEIVFQWSDSWPNYFSYWSFHEPSFKGRDKECVYQFRENGTWATGSCDEYKAFICKVTTEKVPHANTDESGVCPVYNTKMPVMSTTVNYNLTEGIWAWKNIDKKDKKCYWFSSDLPSSYGTTSWGDASLQCRFRNGTLLSIHSQHELDIIKQKVVNVTLNYNTWLGLFEVNGEFVWQDGSGVDFANWYEGQPDYKSDEYCVEMRAEDLKWKQVRCGYTNYYKYYICEIPKIYSSKMSSNDNNSNSSNHRNQFSAASALLLILCFILTLFKYKI